MGKGTKLTVLTLPDILVEVQAELGLVLVLVIQSLHTVVSSGAGLSLGADALL